MYKYRMCFLLILISFICTFSFISAKDNNFILLGKVIYIDPGHGGLDPGAMYKDIKESDINLEISKKLENILENMGAIVYLTRYGDYDLAANNTINRKRSDLSRRSNIINKSGCDVYLSIHLNAEVSSTWRGAQVFFDDINDNNKIIANVLQTQFKKDLNTRREVKEIKNIYLNRRVERPGVLVELGFISNENDRYLLRNSEHQQKIVNSIVQGLVKYFEL